MDHFSSKDNQTGEELVGTVGHQQGHSDGSSTLNDSLANWVMETNMQYYKVDKLLEILSDHLPHCNLPLSCQELVHKYISKTLKIKDPNPSIEQSVVNEPLVFIPPDDPAPTEVRENNENDAKSVKFHVGHIFSMVESTVFASQHVNLNPLIANRAPERYKLPLPNMNKLLDFQILIRADKNERRRLITFLSSVGGDSVSNCTFNILSKLMTNGLRAKVTSEQSGTREKVPLSNFSIIFPLVCEAVRLNQRFKNAAECEIEMAIKEWFQQVRTRKGKK